MSKRSVLAAGSSFCVLILALSITGCGSSKIFYANFESDVVGNRPAENPPGNPTGDLIWLSTSTMNGIATVVNSGELPGKTLRYANVNVPTYNRYVGFFASEVELGASAKIYAYWNGYIMDGVNGSGLEIWLGNSHFMALGLIRFKDGKVYYQSGPGSPSAYVEAGTYVPNRSHFILITVDKATSRYTVGIIQSGGGTNINIGPRAVLNAEALDTARPTLYMMYNEESHGTGKYFIDNVTISEKSPGM